MRRAHDDSAPFERRGQRLQYLAHFAIALINAGVASGSAPRRNVRSLPE